MTIKKNQISIFTLLPLVLLSSLSIDITIAIMSKLVHELHTTQQMLQVTISEFMFVLGCGQILAGPIIDRIGLKKNLYASLFCYFLGSLFCMLAKNIEQLILFRFIQAVGASGCLVSVFVIVQLTFSGDKAARAFSLINGTIAASPLFAPYIGGYLYQYINWQAIFLFLMIFAIGCMVFLFFIENKLPILLTKNTNILHNYIEIFRNKEYIKSVSILVILSIVLFLYFSSSPYIYVEIFKMTPTLFANYFFATGFSFILGSIICSYTSTIHQRTLMFLGLALLFISGICMLTFSMFHFLNILSFLILACMMSFGSSFFFGPLTAYALSFFSVGTASASSLLGFCQFSFPAIIGQCIMMIDVKNVYPLSMTILICSSLTLLIFSTLKIKSI